MIEYLCGKILKKSASKLILDVNGVGYGVEVPLSSLVHLPQDHEACSLWIYTRVREDALKLYGFLSREERDVFAILLDISGVGPKLALAILSTLTISHLKRAVEFGQNELLEAVPGVGKRSAEKILLELKAKVKKFPQPVSTATQGGSLALGVEEADRDWQILEDLSSALENLGYKEKEVSPIIKDVYQTSQAKDFSELVRLALLRLQKVGR